MRLGLGFIVISLACYMVGTLGASPDEEAATEGMKGGDTTQVSAPLGANSAT